MNCPLFSDLTRSLCLRIMVLSFDFRACILSQRVICPDKGSISAMACGAEGRLGPWLPGPDRRGLHARACVLELDRLESSIGTFNCVVKFFKKHLSWETSPHAPACW